MTMLLLNVFGGLAIFIFGMNAMSSGLHKAAGERMQSILRFFSSNRVIAVLSGTVVTAVIQSSSASTVMVIGFVNAGLLNLTQSIGIIFGANIGTTITAQLVAFEISWIIMPSIIVGLLMGFVSSPSIKGWGETIIGFGFLFLGMSIMSDELKSLADHPAFMAAFKLFDCSPRNGWIPPGPLFGAIGIGLAATLIIQSSSACTGIIIALGASNVIDLYTAVALVLGSNIGTTVTAQLAAIPANRIAKQTALAHTLFNVIGVLLMVSTFWLTFGKSDVPIFFRVVNYLSADGDLPRKIANAHTIFNVCTTLILLAFIPQLAWICEKLIPKRKEKVKFQYLEPLLLDTPPVALSQTVFSLRRMLKKAWKMIDCALKTRGKNEHYNKELTTLLEQKENRIDEFQRDITGYLAKLMQRQLLPDQAAAIPLLIHCTNDAERIGDHTGKIVMLISDFRSGKGVLSDAAEGELCDLEHALTKQADTTLSVLENPSPEGIVNAEKWKNTVLDMTKSYENNHLKRVAKGKCSPVGGIFYIELLSEIRKVSRHLGNISERAGDMTKWITQR